MYKFELLTGNTGVLSITDELLDTQDRAEERALSEFLKSAYANNNISFRTYRTDLKLNDTINISGLPYLVKSIVATIDSTKIISSIVAVRYD